MSRKKRLTQAEIDTILSEGKMRCHRCNRVKGLHLFYKSKQSRLGCMLICRVCYRKTQGYKNQRGQHLLRRYDLSLEEYEKLLAVNNGKCWICGGGSTKSLSVDHNHKDGGVRGLLCHPCNQVLGRWKDDPIKASRAMTYLVEDGKLVRDLLGRQPKGSIRKEKE